MVDFINRWIKLPVYIVFFILCIPFQSYAATTEDACKEIQKVSTQMQSQMPIPIDYATDLIGLIAIYAGSTCMVTYNYRLNADEFLIEMRKENSLSLQENLEYLQSAEGKRILQNYFYEQAHDIAKAEMRTFATFKNMQVTYIHIFDRYEIPSIKTVVVDTTK